MKNSTRQIVAYPAVPFNSLLRVLVLLALVLLSGCSTSDWSIKPESCKLRTHVNIGVEDYVKSRFHEKSPLRLAIIPFTVQESFAASGFQSGMEGNQDSRISTDLPRDIQAELLRSEIFPIIEILAEPSWPGKREEFFQGNYHALEIARRAGYDFILVGYLEQVRDSSSLVLHSKLIDTENNVTVWYAEVTGSSSARSWREALSSARLTTDRPEKFHTREILREIAECTVWHLRQYPGNLPSGQQMNWF